MFIDQARIFVKGGDGGNGVVAFRREKYVPLGGPSGGDGGRGGSVVFIADEGMSTLMDFRYNRNFKASRGVHGQGKNMHGAKAEDLIVRVPVGTVIKDDENGEVMADLVSPGQEAIIANGGRGGKGNARFATHINKAPSFAENGAPGEECWVRLELKLLADAGLVGFPNAGKSTLISRISAARPKIADYPFTTLIPNLGVVETRNHDSFVVADIPGLIEGAHEGAGLGHEFLRHIERTRVIIFVLDAAQTDERDIVEDYRILRRELELHNPELARRPYVIVANKMDIPAASDNVLRLTQSLEDKVFRISAVTGEGIDELVDKIFELLQHNEIEEAHVGEERVVRRFEDEPAFEINIVEGVFEVTGNRIEKLVVMTNLDNDDALKRFQRTIQHMGLDNELKARGIKPGDTVRIRDLEFIYNE